MRIIKTKAGIIVFLSVLVLFEGSARIWFNHFAKKPEQYYRYALYTELYRQFQFMPHHYSLYIPRPNWRFNKLSHNSLGYRGKEFSLKKPEGVYRVVVYGGSTIYCTSITDDEKTFTVWLERALRDIYGYQTVEVINGGVGGYNSWESLIDFEFRGLDLNPDLIIIYHGTNDVHPRLVPTLMYKADNSGFRQLWTIPPTFFWEHSCFLRVITRAVGFAFNKPRLKRQVGLESLVCRPNADKFARDVKDSNIAVELLKNNPPIYFRRNIRNMVAIAMESKIEVMLTTWAYTTEFKDDYALTAQYQQGYKECNEIIKEIAKDHNSLLFDFAAVMPKERMYWDDGRHFSEKGAQKAAELFAKFIYENKFIERRKVTVQR